MTSAIPTQKCSSKIPAAILWQGHLLMATWSKSPMLQAQAQTKHRAWVFCARTSSLRATRSSTELTTTTMPRRQWFLACHPGNEVGSDSHVPDLGPAFFIG